MNGTTVAKSKYTLGEWWAKASKKEMYRCDRCDGAFYEEDIITGHESYIVFGFTHTETTGVSPCCRYSFTVGTECSCEDCDNFAEEGQMYCDTCRESVKEMYENGQAIPEDKQDVLTLLFEEGYIE
jgi:hypothetical protein